MLLTDAGIGIYSVGCLTEREKGMSDSLRFCMTQGANFWMTLEHAGAVDSVRRIEWNRHYSLEKMGDTRHRGLAVAERR